MLQHERTAFTEANELLRTDEVMDTRIAWLGQSQLLISCLRGQVYHQSQQVKVGENVITVTLTKDCDQPATDQWLTFQSFTFIQNIPRLILNNPRFAQALRSDGKAIKGDVRVRVLWNPKEVMEVVIMSI